MVQLPGGFDPRQHAPATGEGGSLPVSDAKGHLVQITESEIKETSKKDGWLLALTLTIIDGTAKGQSGVDRLNLGNNSAETVAIALRQLSAICHCVGWLQPVADVSCLHNKPFRVIVVPQDGEENQKKGYTQVKAYRTADGRKPGEQGPPPGTTQAPPAGFVPPNTQAPPQQQAPAVQSNVPFPGQQQAPPAWTAPAQQQAPVQQSAPPPWAQQGAPQGQAAPPPWAQQGAPLNQQAPY